MEIYQTEDQQVVAIKKFWQQNGRTIFTTIVLGLIISAGTWYWRHHAQVQGEHASEVYSLMMMAVQRGDVQTAKSQGAELIERYQRTPYAQIARLMLAKVAIDEEDMAQAKLHLNQLIEQRNAKAPTWHIAKVRLARILQAEGDFESALQLLDGVQNGYAALFEEAKGDLYVAQQEYDKARAAYLLSKAELPEGAQAPWLEMKLMDLGVMALDDAPMQEEV